MAFKSGTSNLLVTFNVHGLHLRWPRLWIIIIGIMLIFLCFCIGGMEAGHTISDIYRGTAFGGFILFIPLLICSIFVLITAFKPTLILIRIAMVLCWIMIFLLMVLIAYDILVLIDPTRCFFLNCANAQVTYQVNSTYTSTVTGWPLSISWPTYFQNEMNNKRIFQSIQILCAGLFMLFCFLYILTYFIYRRIHLYERTTYNGDQHTVTSSTTNLLTTKRSPRNHNNHIVKPPSQNSHNHLITVYTVENRSSTVPVHVYSPVPPVGNTIVPRKTTKKTVVRPRANSVDYDSICTRCMKEPRMVLKTNYERQNFFSHLCVNCNNELFDTRRKQPAANSKYNRLGKH